MKKKTKMSLVVVMLVMSIMFTTVAAYAAPPPAYDGDGNPVSGPTWTYEITEMELPDTTELDRRANQHLAAIRKMAERLGFTVTHVEWTIQNQEPRESDIPTRYYKFEKEVEPWHTQEFYLSQRVYDTYSAYSFVDYGETFGEKYHTSLYAMIMLYIGTPILDMVY